MSETIAQGQPLSVAPTLFQAIMVVHQALRDVYAQYLLREEQPLDTALAQEVLLDAALLKNIFVHERRTPPMSVLGHLHAYAVVLTTLEQCQQALETAQEGLER